ncbi:hypothetical protein [Saccharolobus sp.]|uniref:hypothetical protein n=1 Tax=Saccharolobus sp. TaxID=2100761 RepID=UPI00316B9BA9
MRKGFTMIELLIAVGFLLMITLTMITTVNTIYKPFETVANDVMKTESLTSLITICDSWIGMSSRFYPGQVLANTATFNAGGVWNNLTLDQTYNRVYLNGLDTFLTAKSLNVIDSSLTSLEGSPASTTAVGVALSVDTPSGIVPIYFFNYFPHNYIPPTVYKYSSPSIGIDNTTVGTDYYWTIQMDTTKHASTSAWKNDFILFSTSFPDFSTYSSAWGIPGKMPVSTSIISKSPTTSILVLDPITNTPLENVQVAYYPPGAFSPSLTAQTGKNGIANLLVAAENGAVILVDAQTLGRGVNLIYVSPW